MKISKLRLLVVLFAVLGAVLSACNGNTDEVEQLTPTITFNNQDNSVTADQSVDKGATVNFTVVFAKGNDGKELSKIFPTYRDVNAAGGQATAIPQANLDGSTYETGQTYINPNADTYTLKVRNFSVGNNATTIEFTFRVEDKDGNSASRTIKVTVTADTVIPVPAPRSLSNLSVTNTNRFVCTTCDAGNAVRDEASADASPSLIDFSYFFSTSFSTHSLISALQLKNSIYDGTDAEWDNGVNGTTFRTVTFTSAQFDTLSNEKALDAIFDAGSDAVFANNPAGTRVGDADYASGKVIAFRTAGGKTGLIKITNVASNSSTFSIKVEN